VSEAPRRPPWLRKETLLTPEVIAQRERIARLGLHTVCQSARCPNLSECFQAGNATFLILGDHCTRDCAFCAIGHGPTSAPDAGEGERIASHMHAGGIRYAVITSVTRDDLPDGGAAHFASVVTAIRAALPDAGLELLVPDFRGDSAAIEAAVDLPIQVFAHNLETVPSLYPRARRGADYRRSLGVLERAAARRRPGTLIKTGVMVGLGERREELEGLFADAAGAGVEIVTIGQYLRPSWGNLPVERYAAPAEFAELGALARARGIAVAVAGPYVRSSYLAERAFADAIGTARPPSGTACPPSGTEKSV
jgi:lipoic acid synthetase